MSYFLYISIFVSVIAIIYVWYMTRYINFIPDDKQLILNTDEDKLLVHWYKLHIKQTYDFDTNDNKIAARYLNRIYNIDIDPNLIVLGLNLDTQYFKLTKLHLDAEYTHNVAKSQETSSGKFVDCIFDLRSTCGKPGEIAIIHNSRIRKLLQNNNNLDMSELNLIINSDLDIMANDYLKQILKFRWDKIKELNVPNLLNNEGSYAYIQTNDNIINTDLDGSIIILDNVLAKITTQGARINLLCSNYEFETLIKRWKKYLPTIY